MRAQLLVEGGDETDGQLLLGRPNGDARGEGGDRLVADVLVDEVGGGPELVHVDAGRETEPAERLRRRLRGDAVHRERDRIDGRGDHVRARACRFDRSGERVAPAPCA